MKLIAIHFPLQGLSAENSWTGDEVEALKTLTFDQSPSTVSALGFEKLGPESMQPLFRLRNARFPGLRVPLTFQVDAEDRLAVLGPLKREVLDIIAGKQIADPPKALSYPQFGRDVWPSQAIQLVRFGTSSASTRAPYLSARYESFRDEFDYSLQTVLQQQAGDNNAGLIQQVANDLHLNELMDRWFVGLSNGQRRRAQLALALLKRPKLLIVDEPFLGLDPSNRELMSHVLASLSVPVILGLRAVEETPSWINQLALAAEQGVLKGTVGEMRNQIIEFESKKVAKHKSHRKEIGSQPIIELKDISVAYRGKPIFENINLEVRKGERVHIRGPNGSGKSTLLAMLTADHPQSWNEKVVLFGEPRQVGKHSYFGIQEHFGHSSPELHALFPRKLSVEKSILTGFSEGYIPPVNVTDAQREAVARVIELLGISNDQQTFGDLSLAEQKLTLFARALVKKPEILILDEAFSTLSPKQMERALSVLDKFDGAVLVVGHIHEELPQCDKVLDLGQ